MSVIQMRGGGDRHGGSSSLFGISGFGALVLGLIALGAVSAAYNACKVEVGTG